MPEDATDASDGSSVTLPRSIYSRLTGSCELGIVAWYFPIATGQAIAAASKHLFEGLGLAALTIALITLAYRNWTAQVRCDSVGIDIRGVLLHRSVPWSDVDIIRLGRVSTGKYSSPGIRVRRRSTRADVELLPLAFSGRDRRFDHADVLFFLARAHGVSVKVNDAWDGRPWDDWFPPA